MTILFNLVIYLSPSNIVPGAWVLGTFYKCQTVVFGPATSVSLNRPTTKTNKGKRPCMYNVYVNTAILIIIICFYRHVVLLEETEFAKPKTTA